MRRAAAAVAALALLAPAAASARLSPLPRGWPANLAIGLSDGPGGAAALRGVAGMRYQYLAGGAGTSGNWTGWNPDGSFVSLYQRESAAARILPVFTLYVIRQSPPGAGDGDELRADLSNLRDPSLMQTYFSELRLFFRRVGRARAVLHVEPDMWGYGEQAAGDDARRVPAAIAASGAPELHGLPDTLAGFARAIVRMRDRYAPRVLLAYHLSDWGTKVDIARSDPPPGAVAALARRAARYYRSLGARFDLTFTDVADRDAAFKRIIQGDPGAWWDAADFAQEARFLAAYGRAAGQRVAIWQIPLGNTAMRAMDNSWGHFQDNRVQGLLGDRARLRSYAAAGVIGLLFGGGADGTTCACDARHDGVTNPAPITGNTRTSLSADDDGGLFKSLARAYARRPLRLPR